MKIAFCLSGQPRWLDHGLQNIKSAFSSYDIDYFVHTWWDKSLVNKKTTLNSNRSFLWEENTLEKIISELTPKGIISEPPKTFSVYNDANYETLTPNSVHSMFYSIMVSNEIKKLYEKVNNFKYDLVIRCRFDIVFHVFNLNLYSLDSNNKIYTYHTGAEQLPNDHFAISSSVNMDYYCDLYNNLEKYYREGFRGFIGERLLNYHLNKKDNIKYYTNEQELAVNTIHHINV